MTARVFAYVTHKDGLVDDSAADLVAAAARLDPAQSPTAVLAGWGPDLDAACDGLRGTFGEIWKLSHDAFAFPNAELVRQALVRALPPDAIVLIAHTHFGVDLAPGLSIKMNAAFVSDVVDVANVEGLSLTLVRQAFGGQVSAHVGCDASRGAVLTIRPGAFEAGARPPVAGRVVDRSAGIGALSSTRRYVGTIVAETGDVDITKQSVLVSIGRGIQSADNVALANELAEAIGGAVSCSRPVVDGKWLDKSRQVGSSGKTVQPKVYLACGISGSFQHLAGLKGNPFIVAINKNPKAPIFRVADVGVVDDILEFLPALTARVHERVNA